MTLDFWEIWGYIGTAFFGGSFIVQWIKSERAKASVLPASFWILRLIGGCMLLAYTVHIWKMPLILGQIPGIFIYSRNLMLMRQRAQAVESASVP